MLEHALSKSRNFPALLGAAHQAPTPAAASCCLGRSCCMSGSVQAKGGHWAPALGQRLSVPVASWEEGGGPERVLVGNWPFSPPRSPAAPCLSVGRTAPSLRSPLPPGPQG